MAGVITDEAWIAADINRRLTAPHRKNDGGSWRPIPAMEAADGFTISVQASKWAYCVPRVDPDQTDRYAKVECGFPTAPVPSLSNWKEGDDETKDEDTVYGYVPIERVAALFAEHGGLKEAV